MDELRRGRFVARLATSDADVAAALRLRASVFADDRLHPQGDRFDRVCDHVLVEETGGGALVCCFRMMPLANGAEIDQSYSHQFYDLTRLSAFPGPAVELGRFCVAPDRLDPDILRIAWGAITRYVDQSETALLFGCASFDGTDAGPYSEPFAMLQARHLAPRRWLPRVKAPHVIRYGAGRRRMPNPREALRRMPPLLRTYLAMGGWVSDHAVVDTAMNTLHVFTGVEIGLIPAARKRALRAVAG